MASLPERAISKLEPRAVLDIVYVGTLPPHRGGTATVAEQLVGGLTRRGHTVRALAPIAADQVASADAFAARHPQLQVTWARAPSLSAFSRDPVPVEIPDEYQHLERGQFSRGIERLLAAQRPDVLVIGRETFLQHVVDAELPRSLPTALLIHNETNVRIMEQAAPAARARALRAHYGAVSVQIAVARHLGRRLRALGFPHVRVVENAVDLTLFAPRSRDAVLQQELGIHEDDIVVAHLSNLKAWKRPLDLVESAALALRQDPRLLYLVVGDGLLRSAMEDACLRAGVLHRFRYVGWVDYARMPAYLSLADLVAMPSELEARSMAYLETQASGRVLLASDIPAAREAIADGETGLLFRKGDVQDLTSKTLLAAADPRLRGRIGALARQAAEAHSVTDLLDAYETTLHDVARRFGHVRHGPALPGPSADLDPHAGNVARERQGR